MSAPVELVYRRSRRVVCLVTDPDGRDGGFLIRRRCSAIRHHCSASQSTKHRRLIVLVTAADRSPEKKISWPDKLSMGSIHHIAETDHWSEVTNRMILPCNSLIVDQAMMKNTQRLHVLLLNSGAQVLLINHCGALSSLSNIISNNNF